MELKNLVDPSKDEYIFRVAKVNNSPLASMPKVKTPNSTTIPSTDEIFIKDERGVNVPVTIRYSAQERTLIREHQSDNSLATIIEIGDVGFISLNPKKDAMLINYLLYCNYNMDNDNRNTDKKIIFREIKLEEAENTFLKQKERASKAVNYVLEMDEIELRDYAQAIGKKIEGVNLTKLRTELVVYAERDAERFFENLESPEFEMIIKVNRAFAAGIIKNNGGAIKLVSANRILLSVPAGAIAAKEMSRYFLSEKGKDDWAYVYSQLKDVEDKQKAVKKAYVPTLTSPATQEVEKLTVAELFENCANAKIIERRTPYYYFGEEVLGKSKNDVYQKIEEDDLFRKQIQAQLVMYLK